MSDESIWKAIGGQKNFCSHKLHTKTSILCKNPNNVTGICSQQSCPLANSKYATIRENNSTLFLYIKEPERIKCPQLTYEKIELPDYDNALNIIDKELEYFDNFYKHKCKQRLTKLTQYLQRKSELLSNNKNLNTQQVVKRKFYKKEKKMCEKVKKKVNVESEVEKELIKRMEAGVYGEYVKEVLSGRELKEKSHNEGKKVKDKKVKKQFVSYFEESDECVDAGELKKQKYAW